MGEITVVKDPKTDVGFWLDALSNKNLDQESISLINKLIHREINNFINPVHFLIKEENESKNALNLNIQQLAEQLHHDLTNDLVRENTSVIDSLTKYFNQ
ncbi:hypothetical protein ACH6EH_07025 [Paenibacillus sp. JSM ZJ436]